MAGAPGAAREACLRGASRRTGLPPTWAPPPRPRRPPAGRPHPKSTGAGVGRPREHLLDVWRLEVVLIRIALRLGEPTEEHLAKVGVVGGAWAASGGEEEEGQAKMHVAGGAVGAPAPSPTCQASQGRRRPSSGEGGMGGASRATPSSSVPRSAL
eukprot:scaffold141465_cov26-Tisochrysis_lutea.AAC.2